MVTRDWFKGTWRALLLLACLPAVVLAASGADVLLVLNSNSEASEQIGKYYALKRQIPKKQICWLTTTTTEGISRVGFEREIAAPIASCLTRGKLTDQIKYIVTTLGVPLTIERIKDPADADYAAVDSELALLYSEMKGKKHALPGTIPNPFFGKRDDQFSAAKYGMYLVTRLAAYDVQGVKALIDRSLAATNRGNFVIDMRGPSDEAGNNWLRTAAILLPKERVVLDENEDAIWNLPDVIGYASWGSNDLKHNRRFPGFKWLPGAIVTEFVSTDGRTFARPPDDWKVSRNWTLSSGFFSGSPQSMAADYLLEGATGASGHTNEPYLAFTPRPDILLPVYFSGRNLAESYYLAIPALSWQNIVIGDPLCTLGSPNSKPRP